MKPICKYCYYYCWDFCLANDGSDFPYDFSRSFCGLHGGMEIEDPNKKIDFDLLNGGKNDNFPSALCGFFPKKELVPIQLTLF